MSTPQSTADDPRLTAYLLGELTPSEAAEVEAALAASPDLRQSLEQLRETSDSLFAALQSEPLPQPGLSLPSQSPPIPGQPTAPRPAADSTSRRRSLLMVNAVTVVLFVGGLAAVKQTTTQPPGISDQLVATTEASRTFPESEVSSQVHDASPSHLPASVNSTNADTEQIFSFRIERVFDTDPMDIAPAQTAPDRSPSSRQRSRPNAVAYKRLQESFPNGGAIASSGQSRHSNLDLFPSADSHWAMRSSGELLGRSLDSRQEVYARVQENDFITPMGEDALSTFSIDVDTASYSNVRRYLTHGVLPPPEAVRIEELVNSFTYDLPQPTGDEPFSVTLEATSCPWNPVHRLVRIALQGRTIDTASRPPTRLVFLVDTSGWMASDDKLPLVRDSLNLLVDQLGPQDRIAIVTYSNTAELRLDSTLGVEKERIRMVINSLVPRGSTNGVGGLQLAYDTATRHFESEASNRVILCTDGDFNIGPSSDPEVFSIIETKRQSGVFLSVLGFGTGNLKDSKLEGVANRGNGHYAYIDNLKEARKVLMEQLTGTLYTIAKDVKVQVEFNPQVVEFYRLLGYENRLLDAPDFNNDQIDAGELGAGHTVTALYEIVPVTGQAQPVPAPPAVDPLKYQQPPASSDVEVPATPASPSSDSPASPGTTELPFSSELLTAKLRYKLPDGDESIKREYTLKNEPLRCSDDLQFAAAVAGYGLLLSDSQFSGGCNWSLVIELAQGGLGDDANGTRQEFVTLAQAARRLMEEQQLAARTKEVATGRDQRSPAVSPSQLAKAQGEIIKLLTNQNVAISLKPDHGVQTGQMFDLVRITSPQEPTPNLALEIISVGQVEAAIISHDFCVCRRISDGSEIQIPMQIGDRAIPRTLPPDRRPPSRLSPPVKWKLPP